MTIKYNNVYINESSTITGPYEYLGPLNKYFDYSYEEFYFKEKTWEQAESKLIKDAINVLLNKSSLAYSNIDLVFSSDLLNQLTASNYAAINMPYSQISVYAACASSNISVALAANLIECKVAKKIICVTSSHNNAAEKQFRYPVEYGGPKPKTSTFTVTGAGAILLSEKKSKIRVESATIGKVIDSNIKDVFNMGGVMAKAAASTIYNHLEETKRKIEYYDLVVTGDLGKYGKKILEEYMKSEYNIKLENYEDSGLMIYNHNEKYAGASGPACIALVTYSYIFELMKKNKLKRVLLVATGALHSQSTASQNISIPAIAHAISLEVEQ